MQTDAARFVLNGSSSIGPMVEAYVEVYLYNTLAMVTNPDRAPQRPGVDQDRNHRLNHAYERQ